MHKTGPQLCFPQDLNPKFFLIRKKLIWVCLELCPRVYSDHNHIIKKKRLILLLKHQWPWNVPGGHIALSAFSITQGQYSVPNAP